MASIGQTLAGPQFHETDEWFDAFEAQFLRQFGGPVPGLLFIDRGEEGRYAFALHVDFFNPEGTNLRGASTSCGCYDWRSLYEQRRNQNH
ncbi:hypothetical protein DFH29DRAFT_1001347 [Suillus ampliporus]|nr:hypothetical protein DFH29DRAFT_1001347 [Suillus ampliporus]